MRPFVPPKREPVVAVRDLKSGDKVDLGWKDRHLIEPTKKYIYLQPKTALVLKISFLNHEPVEANPVQNVKLG